MSWRRMNVATFVLFTMSCASASSSGEAPGEEAWACASDRIAIDSITFGPNGGSASAGEALESEILVLADYGVSDKQVLEQALSADSGPTSYDSNTGVLLVDNKVVAQLVATQLPDKTWGVQQVTYCSPPPENNSVGP